MSDSHSWVGRLFHTWGPAAANEWPPRRVLVRCARHVSMSDEHSCRCPVTDTSWQSSVRYAGRRSCSALYTSTAILYCTSWWTGSQCSCWPYVGRKMCVLLLLANVNWHSHTLYVIARQSVCNVRAPYSGNWNFQQCFYAIWYLGQPRTSRWDRPRGNPSIGRVKHKRGSRI